MKSKGGVSMYCLKDNHPKKEYAIYKRVNNAVPYIASILDNDRQVEEFLQAIKRRHEHYRHTYYIDREGYENLYPKELAQFYYKVLERTVNDWQDIA